MLYYLVVRVLPAFVHLETFFAHNVSSVLALDNAPLTGLATTPSTLPLLLHVSGARLASLLSAGYSSIFAVTSEGVFIVTAIMLREVCLTVALTAFLTHLAAAFAERACAGVAVLDSLCRCSTTLLALNLIALRRSSRASRSIIMRQVTATAIASVGCVCSPPRGHDGSLHLPIIVAGM